MTSTPDNWRPPGASDHAGWKVIARAILAVDSRPAYMSSYNVAAEQEAVRDVNEMLERLSGGDAAEGAGETYQHARTPEESAMQSEVEYPAPPRPAPDAMRKALVTEIRNHVAWTMCSEETVDLFDRIVKTLSAPVPSPDGAGESWQPLKREDTLEILKDFRSRKDTVDRAADRIEAHVGTAISSALKMISARYSPSATGAAEPDAVRVALADEINAALDDYLKFRDTTEHLQYINNLKQVLWDNKAGIAAYLSAPAVGVTREAFYNFLDKHTSLPEKTNRYLCKTAEQYGWFSAPDAMVSADFDPASDPTASAIMGPDVAHEHAVALIESLQAEITECRGEISECKELAAENFKRAKIAESELAKAREVIRPFAEYAASDVFQVVHKNAPENLYVMRNSSGGNNITQITVADFRAARAFQGEK